MRRLRADISVHDSAQRFSTALSIDVFIGRGAFTGANTICVNGTTLTFRKAVIATGIIYMYICIHYIILYYIIMYIYIYNNVCVYIYIYYMYVILHNNIHNVHHIV